MVEPPRAAARLYDRPLLRPLLTATALAATRGPAPQEGPRVEALCAVRKAQGVRGPTGAASQRENASASRGAKGVRASKSHCETLIIISVEFIVVLRIEQVQDYGLQKRFRSFLEYTVQAASYLQLRAEQTTFHFNARLPEISSMPLRLAAGSLRGLHVQGMAPI